MGPNLGGRSPDFVGGRDLAGWDVFSGLCKSGWVP